MKIIRLGEDIKTYEYTCLTCNSTIQYTEYDITILNGPWVSTGIESSMRNVEKYIACPVCKKKTILHKWIEEY